MKKGLCLFNTIKAHVIFPYEVCLLEDFKPEDEDKCLQL